MIAPSKLAARSCRPAAALASLPALAQLNVICPVQAEWCTLAATEFEKETGIKVSMTLKGSGESFAQIARRAREPEARPVVRRHRRSAPAGRPSRASPTSTGRPMLAQLHPLGAAAGRAVEVPRRSASTRRCSASATTPSSLAKKKLAPPACWKDLRQAGVQGRGADGEPERVGHRVHGDRDAGAGDGRGAGLRVPEGAAPRTSTSIRARASAPIKAAARGETAASISLHPRRRHRGAGRASR